MDIKYYEHFLGIESSNKITKYSIWCSFLYKEILDPCDLSTVIVCRLGRTAGNYQPICKHLYFCTKTRREKQERKKLMKKLG